MKAALFLVALALTACSAPGSSLGTLPPESSGAARTTNDILGGAPAFRVKVKLFDAPITALAGARVNVGIVGIQFLSKSTAVSFLTNQKPQVVNLLDLQDSPLMFDGSAPAGQYTGIRMLIDSSNSNVTVGSLTLPIIWGAPGKATNAPVIAVDFACAFSLAGRANNGVTNISLDFNVLQSVRLVNGSIYLEPSVTAANSAGEVKGTILNRAGAPVSNATVLALNADGRTVNSTVTKKNGSFVIHALPPGPYTITVNNTYVTKAGETVMSTNADAGAAPSASVYISPEEQLQLDSLID